MQVLWSEEFPTPNFEVRAVFKTSGDRSCTIARFYQKLHIHSQIHSRKIYGYMHQHGFYSFVSLCRVFDIL